MFYDIPRNVWRHSPEWLGTFPGMFEDIPRNVWWPSPECLATFPGMFGDIPWNLWGHSAKYYISTPLISRVPHIPFPVPVFLFLYIAQGFQLLWETCIEVLRKIFFKNFFLSIALICFVIQGGSLLWANVSSEKECSKMSFTVASEMTHDYWRRDYKMIFPLKQIDAFLINMAMPAVPD